MLLKTMSNNIDRQEDAFSDRLESEDSAASYINVFGNRSTSPSDQTENLQTTCPFPRTAGRVFLERDGSERFQR
jgi:hypothetical protein